MRLFEVLLILSSIVLLLDLCFSKNTNGKKEIIICTACSTILIFQLFFEGYRWQMLFVYIIIVLLSFAVLYKFLNQSRNKKMWKPLKYILCTIAAVFIGIATFLCLYLPVFKLPEPDGAYKIGTRTLHFVDDSRNEVLTQDKNDKRELMVQIWYPAENKVKKNPELLFPGNREVFKKYEQAYSRDLGLPGFIFDYWRYIGSNSYDGLELATTKSPFPLIIICHGMGTSRILHTSQAEKLASNGYIVVAADHTYSTTATAFPDGKVTDYIQELTKYNFYDDKSGVGARWMEDVEFVIHQLEVINSSALISSFKGKIDLNNIGIMGHSFGGAVAFNEFYFNDKIKAGINMDGSLYNLENMENITKPFMFMESEDFIKNKEKFESLKPTDEGLKANNISMDEYNKMLQEFNIINNVVQHGGTMISIKGSSHFNFTDFQLFSDLTGLIGMTGKIKGSRGTKIVNEYILDFFNKNLKGIGGDLLKGSNPKYPEVELK